MGLFKSDEQKAKDAEEKAKREFENSPVGLARRAKKEHTDPL
jgi:hypothetical protein